MQAGTRRSLFSFSGLAILAVVFVVLIMLSNTLLKGMRLDLTADKLYSVSEGTRNIVGDIAEPINLYLFFSDRTSAEVPTLRNYATRVREFLEELELESGGRLNLEVVDPLPFSEDEDRAAQFGIAAVPLRDSADSIYFGLVGTNAVDDVETIPFFDPQKENFLEYDIANLIYRLNNRTRPVIGLLSMLPMDRGFDPQTRQMTEPWVVVSQIEQLFDLRRLQAPTAKIDDDIAVLMLVHPKGLDEQTLYAIDQYLLRGGKAIVFVDPRSEADNPATDPADPMAGMTAVRSSNMSSLFDAWGLEYNENVFVGDRARALQIGGFDGRPVSHVGVLGLTKDELSADDIVTGQLGVVNLAIAGSLSKSDGAEISFEPLLTSSADSMVFGTERLQFMPDPNALRNGFAATDETYVLAARLSGTFSSAFPDGAPVPVASDETPDTGQHLAEGSAPTSVIVVADTDMLTDGLWVQVQQIFGQRLISAWADNGDFVFNALDNLTGSTDLISIRGRASYQRPFERVAELQRDAEDQYRQTEERLQQELAETERKLTEMEASRQDDSALILSDAQRQALADFQDERVRIRKELRQVRRSLDQDIERLGNRLKMINIGLVPLLLTIVALSAVVVRRRRRHTQTGATS